MFTDSHTHLNFAETSEVEMILDRAKKQGVERIVNIGTSLEDSRVAILQSSSLEGVFATVGIHPNDNVNTTVESVNWNDFAELAKMPKVVAIGECGLDYSHIAIKNIDFEPEKTRQKKLFLNQLSIAKNLNLPLSIHVRDAYDDTLMVFKSLTYPIKAVFHCMSGTPTYFSSLEEISRNLNSQFYYSFAGNITFKNTQSLVEIAKLVPLEKLLIETDSPFLAPEPLRGSKNEPANVTITAAKLAEIKGVTTQEIARITSENATQVFNLK